MALLRGIGRSKALSRGWKSLRWGLVIFFCVTEVHIKRFQPIICLAWAISRRAKEFYSVAGVRGWGNTETCPTENTQHNMVHIFLPRT